MHLLAPPPVTSAVSIMEAVVSSIMDEFHISRIKAAVIEFVVAMVFGIVVCLGYNDFYFELTLPNGATAQVLDLMDYVSNNLLMPIVAIATCVLIGWVAGPQVAISEFEKNGESFSRTKIYIFMIKYVAPVMLFILLVKSSGLITF